MRVTYSENNKKYLKIKFTEFVLLKYLYPILISIILETLFIGLFINEIIKNIQNGLPIFSFLNIILLPFITFLSISILQILLTYLLGLKRIKNGNYIIERLVLKQKIKNNFLLNDNHSYKIYGIHNKNRVLKKRECDIITITNNYGFILWEFSIPKPYKLNRLLTTILNINFLEMKKSTIQ